MGNRERYLTRGGSGPVRVARVGKMGGASSGLPGAKQPSEEAPNWRSIFQPQEAGIMLFPRSLFVWFF